MKNFPGFGHAHLRLLAWTTFVLAIVSGGYLRYYLAPWNARVVTAGGVMLGVLFVAGFALVPEPDEPAPFKRLRAWFLTMSHFVPLVLFVIVGPSMPGLDVMSHAAFMPLSPPRERDEGLPRHASPGEHLSVSIADLRTAPEKFEGEPIEVLGRIHLITEEERKALPPAAESKNIRMLLYRYMITCCVADAVPISCVTQDVKPETVTDDEWYRVRGRCHYEQKGLDIPFIAVESLERVPEPVNPYLSAIDEVCR